ncbi:acyltransferase [Proteus mirabilis]|uniref:acyltransferase family protein n=1 Tax=Proteus mirabilis TaxID=584 RepID=UPI002181F721|nr:acyltransferase [Proteus mirabilis]MCT0069329.1 acyltransferase [Proteus mirabilis]MDC9754716.1 acyltransferase [Proteus mirabilis]MDF7163660.1 acyltransferase [Proteus mirabilis]MEC3990826.1 acyltransferase [Proteus mirabilis]MEC4039665.1 acyltransferase [Proteus mirabilis]
MVWSVHYLRGIAALFVVFYHTRSYLNHIYAESKLGDMFFGWGYFGVDIFFMISGFVIMLSTENEKSKVSFPIKRFFRIYPLYFVVLMFFVIDFSLKGSIPTTNIVKSIFFIHLNYDINAPFFGYSVNLPGWTLTYELMFYGVFFIALCISHKYRSFICSGLIIVIYFTINLNFSHLEFNAYSSVNYNGRYTPIIKILSSPMMWEFIIGMMLFYIYSFLKKYNYLLRSSNVLIINTIIFIFSISLIISPIKYGHGLLNVGVGCFLLLLTCIIYELSGRLKKSALLSFFGDISYSLYISHAFTIMILTTNKELFSYVNQLRGFNKQLIVLTIVIAFAFILHKAIEIPLVSFGKSFLKKVQR